MTDTPPPTPTVPPGEYRPRPSIVQAVQWDGTNIDDVRRIVRPASTRLTPTGNLAIRTPATARWLPVDVGAVLVVTPLDGIRISTAAAFLESHTPRVVELSYLCQSNAHGLCDELDCPCPEQHHGGHGRV